MPAGRDRLQPWLGRVTSRRSATLLDARAVGPAAVAHRRPRYEPADGFTGYRCSAGMAPSDGVNPPRVVESDRRFALAGDRVDEGNVTSARLANWNTRILSHPLTPEELRTAKGRLRAALLLSVGDRAAACLGRVTLLVRAIARAHERAREHRTEPERLALLAEPAELVGVNPAVDLRVLREGCRYWPIVTTSTPCARRSRIVSTTSSFVSPSPTMIPDLVSTR